MELELPELLSCSKMPFGVFGVVQLLAVVEPVVVVSDMIPVVVVDALILVVEPMVFVVVLPRLALLGPVVDVAVLPGPAVVVDVLVEPAVVVPVVEAFVVDFLAEVVVVL